MNFLIPQITQVNKINAQSSWNVAQKNLLTASSQMFYMNEIIELDSLQKCWSVLLKFICPIENSVLLRIDNNLCDKYEMKLLTRLLVLYGLNYLNEHKFLHNFMNTLTLLCSCSLKVKSVTLYLLHC